MRFSKRISGYVATIYPRPLVKSGCCGCGCGTHFALASLSSPFHVEYSNLFHTCMRTRHTGNYMYLGKNTSTLSAHSCPEAYHTCLSSSVRLSESRGCNFPCTGCVCVRCAAPSLPSPLLEQQSSSAPQSPQKRGLSRNQSYSSLLLPSNSYGGGAKPDAITNRYRYGTCRGGHGKRSSVERLGLRPGSACAWDGGVFIHRKTSTSFAMAESVRSFSSTSRPLFTPYSNCGQKGPSGSKEEGGRSEREDINASEKTFSHHNINPARGGGDATEAAIKSECELSDCVVVPRREGYYMLSSLRCVPSNDTIDPACYSILTCRGSGPGGQGANSSSSKVELRVDLGILELYLEECIENGQMGQVRGPPDLRYSHQREKGAPPQRDSSTCVDGGSNSDESSIGGEITGEVEEEGDDADGDESTDPENNENDARFPPSSSSISMAERFTDEVISDPEAYLRGLAPHERIVAKIKAKLPMLLKHRGGGGGNAPNQNQSSAVCTQTTATIRGPAAELVGDGSILTLTCNQHRSNRQNISDCLAKLREITVLF